MSDRRTLTFATLDDVSADIRKLRAGYRKTGNWSLEQICWHLDKAMQYRMAPGPHADTTPEQAARRPEFERVLATGKLPSLTAPDPMTPPADSGAEAIDSVLKIIEQFKNYQGEIAPHRIFGKLPEADARKLNLIHCAHHLSYLVPTEG